MKEVDYMIQDSSTSKTKQVKIFHQSSNLLY